MFFLIGFQFAPGHRFDYETPVEEVVRAFTTWEAATCVLIAHDTPALFFFLPTWADASASRRCPEGLGPLPWHEFMLGLAMYVPFDAPIHQP